MPPLYTKELSVFSTVMMQNTRLYTNKCRRVLPRLGLGHKENPLYIMNALFLPNKHSQNGGYQHKNPSQMIAGGVARIVNNGRPTNNQKSI
jgi:hypothetical protein